MPFIEGSSDLSVALVMPIRLTWKTNTSTEGANTDHIKPAEERTQALFSLKKNGLLYIVNMKDSLTKKKKQKLSDGKHVHI